MSANSLDLLQCRLRDGLHLVPLKRLCMLSAAKRGFCCQILHKLSHSRTCSVAAREGIRSCSRVAAEPTTRPWTNQCVCTICSELFGLRRLNSPELVADCWLVFPSALPDPVAFSLSEPQKDVNFGMGSLSRLQTRCMCETVPE